MICATTRTGVTTSGQRRPPNHHPGRHPIRRRRSILGYDCSIDLQNRVNAPRCHVRRGFFLFRRDVLFLFWHEEEEDGSERSNPNVLSNHTQFAQCASRRSC